MYYRLGGVFTLSTEHLTYLLKTNHLTLLTSPIAMILPLLVPPPSTLLAEVESGYRFSRVFDPEEPNHLVLDVTVETPNLTSLTCLSAEPLGTVGM